MIKYLSPSSLMTCEKQPYTFLATRILKNMAKEPQGGAASVGSSFDAYIKNLLSSPFNRENMRQRVIAGCYNDEDKKAVEGMSPIDTMFHLSVEPHNREMARLPGMNLACSYIKSTTCKRTLWHDFEMHQWYDLWWKGIKIPLFMKLDALIMNQGKTNPFDWKVMGATSESGASPPQGYCQIEALDDSGVIGDAHDSYFTDMPMHLINESWATQLCTYGWGTGHAVGKPFCGHIDCLCYRKTGWRVARYIGLLTTDFQYALADRYHQAWKALQTGAFERRLVSDPDVACALARAESWF